MNHRWLCLIFVAVSILANGCAFKRVSRSKNITYEGPASGNHQQAQQLSVFAPHKSSGHNVLIFIHGGNWNAGRKSLYNFFGSRLARKGVVAVIIDYPLSPGATSNDMAKSSARAVEWTRDNIAKYGGDPKRIFVSGHSAGGQLAALISIRHEYFDSLNIENPVKGIILIDAAGLDMYGYLKGEHFPFGHTYFKTFTHSPEIWKQQSPLYWVHKNMPPMLIYRGGKTYPMIASSNDKFLTALRPLNTVMEYHLLKNKKHVPMITQFLFSWNPHYDEILTFMKQ